MNKIKQRNQEFEQEIERLRAEVTQLGKEKETQKTESEAEIQKLKDTIEDLEHDKNSISTSKESVSFLITHIFNCFSA